MLRPSVNMLLRSTWNLTNNYCGKQLKSSACNKLYDPKNK